MSRSTLSVLVAVMPALLCSCDKVCDEVRNFDTELDVHLAESCNTISGDLIFQDQSLTSLDLPELTTVEGDILIADNDDLIDVTLSSLETVGGTIQIDSNDELTTLSLPALQTAGGLYADDCDEFDTIDAPALTTLEEGLSLQYLPDLRDLDGFGSITSARNLFLFNLHALRSIEGLSRLTEIETTVYIQHNDCLSDAEVDGFIANLEPDVDAVPYDNGDDYPCP